jgi:hypothetical protein
VVRTQSASPRYLLGGVLLVAVLPTITVCTVVCVASRLQKADKQKQARETLRDGHAWFYYQRKWDQPSLAPGVVASEAPGYSWVRHLLGDDFFFDVDSVHLNHTTDEDMRRLEAFTSLTCLSLAFPAISNKGLVHLKGLTKIRMLDLNCLGDQLGITDDALENLEGLERLEILNLGGANISDNGLAHLRRLVRLKELALTNTSVTDKGMRYLCGLSKMRRLLLGGTKITDAGIRSLERMDELEELDLQRSRISDNGLKHLKRLTSLRHLHLADTRVTEAACDALRRALPKCDIESGNGTEKGSELGTEKGSELFSEGDKDGTEK